MIIDAHVHICPKEIRENRDKFLDGEPEFGAIYKDPRAKLAGAEDLIKKMETDGVDKSIVFGFPWRKEKNFKLNNDYVLECAKKYPDRLIPFCCLSLQTDNVEREVKRCLLNGAKGIGEVAFYTKDLDREERKLLSKIAGLCREAKVPLLLHTNEPVGHLYPGKSPMTLKNLYILLKENPDTKWILGHLGGGLPFFGLMKKEVREVIKNCWFDTAAMIFLYRTEALSMMMDIVGEEKFVFGTDFPLLPPSRYFKEFKKIPSKRLNKLLGENLENLFNSLR